jgi:hypothetical protein
MPDYRLGDDIDDYCVRCKRLTNHLVVSVLKAEPAKVRCRTCHSDHDYRREQAPPPKVDLRKAALFQEVLKKVDPGAAPIALPLVVHVADFVPEPAVEQPAVEEAAPPQPAPKAKAKATPKPKAKLKGKART